MTTEFHDNFPLEELRRGLEEPASTDLRPKGFALDRGNLKGYRLPEKFGIANIASQASVTLGMIHGEKKWMIIHPDFTPYLYPMLHPQGIYAISAIDALKPLDLLEREGYRLWRYVPKRYIHLREGDVYYNPQWWWHLVENPTETSIGLAFRVLPGSSFGGNPMFTLLMMSSPHIMKILIRWLVTRSPSRDVDILDHLFFSKSDS